MVVIMGKMSNLDMDMQTINTIYNSDDQLRDCVNDLLVVIGSMQEKIENLSNKIDKVEGKIEELL